MIHSDREHLGCRVRRFGDSTGPPVTSDRDFLGEESVLFGEPQGGSAWRSQLQVHRIMVTAAKASFDHLPKTGPTPKKPQAMIDRLVIKSPGGELRGAHDVGADDSQADEFKSFLESR